MNHYDFCYYARVETSKTPGCACDFEFEPRKEEPMNMICANCATEMFADGNVYRCPCCGLEITATEPGPVTVEDK
jgi:hypothetical protein